MMDFEENRDISPEDVQDHDGHRDRIRLRILTEGLDALGPLQILEFMLYYVLPRQDVGCIAQALLDHFGDLNSLFHSTLDDFRQVKGLGETGAQWMGIISRCMKQFTQLPHESSIALDNPIDLSVQVKQMRSQVSMPYCVQLLTDENDLLLLRRPLAPTLLWANLDVMRAALDDASSAPARNAYMLVFTHDHRSHPNAYDLNHIHDYTLLLNHADCVLRDMLFISDYGHISMRRLNLIPDIALSKNLRRFVAEDEMDALQQRELKIIKPFPEE